MVSPLTKLQLLSCKWKFIRRRVLTVVRAMQKPWPTKNSTKYLTEHMITEAVMARCRNGHVGVRKPGKPVTMIEGLANPILKNLSHLSAENCPTYCEIWAYLVCGSLLQPTGVGTAFWQHPYEGVKTENSISSQSSSWPRDAKMERKCGQRQCDLLYQIVYRDSPSGIFLCGGGAWNRWHFVVLLSLHSQVGVNVLLATA